MTNEFILLFMIMCMFFASLMTAGHVKKLERKFKDLESQLIRLERKIVK